MSGGAASAGASIDRGELGARHSVATDTRTYAGTGDFDSGAGAVVAVVPATGAFVDDGDAGRDELVPAADCGRESVEVPHAATSSPMARARSAVLCIRPPYTADVRAL